MVKGGREGILRDGAVELKISTAVIGLLDSGVRPDGFNVLGQLGCEWHVSNVRF
jgi:hypothetical protein